MSVSYVDEPFDQGLAGARPGCIIWTSIYVVAWALQLHGGRDRAGHPEVGRAEGGPLHTLMC
jgi:hypothetical protein